MLLSNIMEIGGVVCLMGMVNIIRIMVKLFSHNLGDFYIGRFKNGLKHGDGVELYGNGDKYKG